eukprot:5581289-Prorocentrum_lima.AAC.1
MVLMGLWGEALDLFGNGSLLAGVSGLSPQPTAGVSPPTGFAASPQPTMASPLDHAAISGVQATR